MPDEETFSLGGHFAREFAVLLSRPITLGIGYVYQPFLQIALCPVAMTGPKPRPQRPGVSLE